MDDITREKFLKGCLGCIQVQSSSPSIRWVSFGRRDGSGTEGMVSTTCK